MKRKTNKLIVFTMCVFSWFFVPLALSQSISTFPHTESFEGTTFPYSGWVNEQLVGSYNWAMTTQNGNSTIYPRTGSKMAEFRNTSSGSSSRLISPQLELASMINPTLRFYYANVNWVGDIDQLEVYYRTSATGTWIQLGPTITDEHTSWTLAEFALPDVTDDYYISFVSISEYARGMNIDDVTIEDANPCLRPTNLAISDVTSDSGLLTWTAGGTETEWTVYWGTPGFTIDGAGQLGSEVISGTPELSLLSLDDFTSYEVYVFANCGVGETSDVQDPIVFTTTEIPVLTPYYEDFSVTTEWATNDATVVNKWYIGSAKGNPANGMYISNDNGATWGYTGTYNVAHTYITVALPASSPNPYKLSFDWDGFGEGTWDYGKVWLVPASANLPVNALITTSNVPGAFQLGSNLVGANDWTAFSMNIPPAYMGTTFKLVFEWKNDGSNNNTPLAIDNIAIYYDEEVPPISETTTTPSCLTGTELVVVGTPSTNYTWYWQTTETGTSTDNDATTPWNVMENGTYYARAYNSFTDTWSDATSYVVTTIPAETAPPAPIAASNPACTPGTELVMIATPPVDVTYYWQGTSDISSSTANSTATPSFADVTGTYYVKAFNSATSCWSLPTGLLVTVDTEIPAAPIADPSQFDFCSGVATAEITVDAPVGVTDITWYDEATNGNVIGFTEELEAVGTSVLTVATPGSYEFYAESAIGGCVSPTRTLVVVNIKPVVVELIPVSVTCNNGNDGTFTLGAVTCGVEPFTYSVDGGTTFGSIPTNLIVGSHEIIVQDANGEQSSIITIVVGDAAAPSNLDDVSVTNNQAVIEWTSTGTETQWNIEWGLPGFTPGNGEEIGSATTSDPSVTITDLTGNTEYEVYVSANCGSGTTAGTWSVIDIWTTCDPFVLPFGETFNSTSESIPCWMISDYVGDGIWYLGVGDDGLNLIDNTFEGDQNVIFYGEYTSGGRLISPAVIVTGQDSIALTFALSQGVWFGDQNITTVQVRNGQTGAWTTERVYTQSINEWMVDTIIIQTTGIDTLYFSFLATGDYGYPITIDAVNMEACFIDPTADGSATVCQSEGSIDLTSIVTPTSNGVWESDELTSLINGSDFNFSLLAEGTYIVKHVSSTACAYDTALVTINITSPVSAGIDGMLQPCRNQMIDLFGGLSGTVDFGGTWYAPDGSALTSSYFQTGTLVGQQVYKYIVSNGVCDADTSEVIVNILSCNFIGVEDVDALENVSVSPNPTTESFKIEGIPGADYSFELLDVNGRVVLSSRKITASVTHVDISKFENGVYMLNIKNADSSKMMRVIKQ